MKKMLAEQMEMLTHAMETINGLEAERAAERMEEEEIGSSRKRGENGGGSCGEAALKNAGAYADCDASFGSPDRRANTGTAASILL